MVEIMKDVTFVTLMGTFCVSLIAVTVVVIGGLIRAVRGK